jgi:hypothetical protein
VLAACGGAPASATDGPASCTAVAAHFVRLGEAESGGPLGDELATGLYRETHRQCTRTPWSAERRSCLVAARSMDDTLPCPLR